MRARSIGLWMVAMRSSGTPIKSGELVGHARRDGDDAIGTWIPLARQLRQEAVVNARRDRHLGQRHIGFADDDPGACAAQPGRPKGCNVVARQGGQQSVRALAAQIARQPRHAADGQRRLLPEQARQQTPRAPRQAEQVRDEQSQRLGTELDDPCALWKLAHQRPAPGDENHIELAVPGPRRRAPSAA